MATPYPGEVRGPWDRDQAAPQQQPRGGVVVRPGPQASPQTQAQAQKDQLDVTNAALTPGNVRFNQASKLRDDYNQNPEVRAYNAAVPIYASALQSGEDPSGDQLLIYSFAKMMDPTSAVRESEYGTVANSDTWARRTIAQLSNQLNASGTLSPEIRQSLRMQMNNRLNQLNAAVSQRREQYRQTAERAGLNPADVIGDYPGAPFADADRKFWEGQGAQIAGDQPPEQAAQPGAPQQRPAQRGEVVNQSTRYEAPPGDYIQGKGPPTLAPERVIHFSTKQDEAYASDLREAFSAGVPTMEQLDEITRKHNENGQNYAPLPPDVWKKAIDLRRQGRAVVIAVPQSGVENRTAFQAGMTKFMGSEAGAATTGVANGATFGTLDEIGAGLKTLKDGGSFDENLERANTFKQLVREEHPYWFAGGEIGGSMVPGIAATKGLTNAGLQIGSKALSPAAIGVDATLAGLYGAGENNENRAQGGLVGMLGGAAGGVVGRGAMNQAGRMIAPTGGYLTPLYEAGVRPTPGQRFGGAVGDLEEALGSSPIMGQLVKRARQRARDQFETGGFNDALAEIGSRLPPDVPFGTKAHKFMQGAFNDVYRKAERRMQFVRDADFENDLATIMSDAQNGGLTSDALRRLKAFVTNEIDRRAPSGTMGGKDFHKASSRLKAVIRGVRNNKSGDQELGDALELVKDAVTNAARRNSKPKPVAELAAADKGYAKAVRIKEASRGRGTGGRYTPAKLDSAVQKLARGPRGEEYLGGDALMQDYATAGRALSDKLPDSGTTNRMLVTTGAAALTPVSWPAILPYGLHGVTGGLMAPRTGPMAPALNATRGWFERMAPRGGDIGRQLSVQKQRRDR